MEASNIAAACVKAVSEAPQVGEAAHWLGLAAECARRNLGAEHRDRIAACILALDPASPYHVANQ